MMLSEHALVVTREDGSRACTVLLADASLVLAGAAAGSTLHLDGVARLAEPE